MKLHFIVFILYTTSANPGIIQNKNVEIVPVEIGKLRNKKFYEIPLAGKTNWFEAKTACAEKNLEFGRTDNFEEFNFLYGLRKGVDYWVAASQKGLLNEGPYKAFEWTDGSHVEFGINFHQSSSDWLCLYFSRDHYTYVDTCISSQHNILCQFTENKLA